MFSKFEKDVTESRSVLCMFVTQAVTGRAWCGGRKVQALIKMPKYDKHPFQRCYSQKLPLATLRKS